jgi:regulator of protease activity HflC (stomatin/prohibitin superfamily)
MLAVGIAVLLGGLALVVLSIAGGTGDAPIAWMMIVGFLVIALAITLLAGLFALQPNEARLLVLFGSYRGTVRTPGFHWANPFYSNGAIQGQAAPARAPTAAPERKQARSGPQRFKISLRARTFLTDRLKVNDRRGNPVEIAAVVVWRVEDTAKAAFDVDAYESYVSIQAETALRHVATAYAYDHGEDDDAAEITLRSNVQEVSATLRDELAERLAVAGVAVDDARLTHLAYAPEIAQVMLRRQQAEAVIAARRKIVHGAVTMVEMALDELGAKRLVEFDADRRAAMVSNLMVVLCGEAEVTPVVNTGSPRT